MKTLITISAIFAPILTFAFPSDFRDAVNQVISFIYIIIPIVASLALFVFFKGLAGFILKAGDTSSHKEGRNLMLWGLVGLFIMVSLWGILRFIYNDFGFSRPFGVPTLPTGTNLKK